MTTMELFCAMLVSVTKVPVAALGNIEVQGLPELLQLVQVVLIRKWFIFVKNHR